MFDTKMSMKEIADLVEEAANKALKEKNAPFKFAASSFTFTQSSFEISTFEIKFLIGDLLPCENENGKTNL